MCYLFFPAHLLFSVTWSVSLWVSIFSLTKQRYHLSTLTVFIRINEIIWSMSKQHMVGTKGLNSLLLFLYLHLFFFFFLSFMSPSCHRLSNWLGVLFKILLFCVTESLPIFAQILPFLLLDRIKSEGLCPIPHECSDFRNAPQIFPWGRTIQIYQIVLIYPVLPLFCIAWKSADGIELLRFPVLLSDALSSRKTGQDQLGDELETVKPFILRSTLRGWCVWI